MFRYNGGALVNHTEGNKGNKDCLRGISANKATWTHTEGYVEREDWNCIGTARARIERGAGKVLVCLLETILKGREY